MSKIMMGHQIGQSVIDALGLPKLTRSFTLRCAVDEPVIVNCEYYLESGAELVSALAQYMLAGRSEQVPANVQPGPYFETWMRTRTEAAHAAYMARHACGGVSYGPAE